MVTTGSELHILHSVVCILGCKAYETISPDAQYRVIRLLICCASNGAGFVNDQSENTNFWKNLPGILTGLAALVTAVAGLSIYFLHEPSTDDVVAKLDSPEPLDIDPCYTAVWGPWQALEAHTGELTNAVNDALVFLEVVVSLGCSGHTYVLNINKQNIGQYVVTVFEPYPHNGFKYREATHTLEVGGQKRPPLSSLFRSPLGEDNWAMVESPP